MKPKQVDLSKPAGAREWLSTLTVSGAPITGVTIGENQRWLEFKDMTDEQAIRYANDLFFDFFGGYGVGDIVSSEMMDQIRQ